jgi:hypothetical protein
MTTSAKNSEASAVPQQIDIIIEPTKIMNNPSLFFVCIFDPPFFAFL